MSAPIASSSPRETSPVAGTGAAPATDNRPHAAAPAARRSGRSYSSLLLAGSNFGTFAFTFLRGVALARLLSPQDFGLAISITTVSSVVDIICDVGLYQFAVRVTDPAALPTLHSIGLIRATFVAAMIVVCSPLFAYLFNAPGTAWAYALVALAPFLRGFFHLNVKTAMRSFDFRKEAMTDLGSQITWTIVSIGSALLLHDYRAMVFGIVASGFAIAVMTHLLAGTRWRLGWDRAVVREAARFGRPLIPNGAAIVLVNMGDRTLVGSYLGLDALANYSVLSTSAFLPRTAIVRFTNAIMTPQFVNAATPERRERLLVISGIILSFIGGCFAFGYMAFGQSAIMLLFGKHYVVTQGIVSLIAILSCVRYLATITTPVGVAKGDTGLIFLNTATSAIGLVLGLILVLRTPTLETMVSGMCMGELAALLYIIHRLLRLNKVSSSGVWSATVLTLVLVLGCAATIYFGEVETLLPKIGIGLGFTMAEIALLATIMFVERISIRNIAGVFLPKHLQPIP